MKRITDSVSARLGLRVGLILCLLVAMLPIGGCATSAPPAATRAPVLSATRVPTTAPAAQAQPTATPPVAVTATAAPAAELVSASTDGPQLPGETIALETGGALFVPEGALPQDNQIEPFLRDPPPLPDDVKPLGQALELYSDVQPSQPVTLRLPIPEGVADPTNLAIVSSATDGTTTFLLTEVENQELVAVSNIVSTFTTVELPAEEIAVIVGVKVMAPGSRTTLFVPRAPAHGTAEGHWSVGDLATIVYESSNTVILEAGAKPGTTRLTYSNIDASRGRRWFGAVSIVIAEPRSAATVPFSVSLVTQTPQVYPGQSVRFVASVQGEPEYPLMWRWDFGSEKGWPTPTEGKVRTFEQTKAFDPPSLPKNLSVVVTVIDDLGRTASQTTLVRVIPETMRIALVGPDRLEWHDGGSTSAYDASVTGGKLPYRYTWRLWPGEEPREISDFDTDAQSAKSSQLFAFPEPGGYRLEVTVEDMDKTKARAVLPIVVDGGEDLTTSLLNFPSTAKVGKELEVYARMRGGVTTVAGKKLGYTLLVMWGDGKAPLDKQGVGTALSSAKGVVLIAKHTYDGPDTYTARIVVSDAASNYATEAYQIVVTEDGAAPPPTAAAQPNRPPVAEEITTSTSQGAPVAITLHGTDADVDDLTYTVVKGPVSGSLSGTPPLLTYTPRSGFSGSDTFTYKVNDGQADSNLATVRITIGGLRWVRDGEPLINASGERLDYRGGGSQSTYFPEPRFEGKYTIYDVNETNIAVDDREVDGGHEYWTVTIRSDFDAPPAVLLPGEKHELSMTFWGTGRVDEGYSPGAIFQYGADRAHLSIIQPADTLGYYPWAQPPSTEISKAWTLTVPNGKPGDTFQVWAGWWNCAMCNVTWTYKAE